MNSLNAPKRRRAQSALPPPILSQIWKLADVDKDGALNEYEFIVATHLTKLVQKMVSGKRSVTRSAFLCRRSCLFLC